MNEDQLITYVQKIIDLDIENNNKLGEWKFGLSPIPPVSPNTSVKTFHVVQPIELGVGRRVLEHWKDAYPNGLNGNPSSSFSGHYFFFYSL